MDERKRDAYFAYLYDPDYERQLVKWALGYNAYHRLGAAEWEPWGGVLQEIIRPLAEDYLETGSVPKWAGIDLLRGWAFLITRVNRHEDGYLLEAHPEMLAIVEAITNHPAVRESDLPPRPPDDFWDRHPLSRTAGPGGPDSLGQ